MCMTAACISERPAAHVHAPRVGRVGHVVVVLDLDRPSLGVLDRDADAAEVGAAPLGRRQLSIVITCSPHGGNDVA